MSAPGALERQALSDYDEIPYDCHAHPVTHPDRMALAAFLAGVSAAPPARCRLLELGCGNGANLLPMAFHLPEGRFLGVDLSARHIEDGRAAQARLGLDNLELRHADITALGDDLGEFDYVVVHGVYSWVAEPVRRRILEIAARHLAPEGILYLSYNVLPGWGVRGEVRRALLLRAGSAGDPRERIRRARGLLQVLSSAMLEAGDAHLAVVRGEIAFPQGKGDAYLLHEFLAPENRAFAFSEVAADAAARGLEYLAELSPAGTPEAEARVRARLAASLSDPVEIEQHADLLTFRHFRATLFCRAGRLPAARPDTAALFSRCTLATALRPVSAQPSLDPDVEEMFEAPDGRRISARPPLLKAALAELARSFPCGLSLGGVVERAEALLALRAGGRGAGEDAGRLVTDLAALHGLGHVSLRVREPAITARVGATPDVGALARLEAERGASVTSALHGVVELDDFARATVRLLDGSRDAGEIVDALVAAFERGEVPLSVDGVEIMDSGRARQVMPALVGEVMIALTRHGLLLRA